MQTKGRTLPSRHLCSDRPSLVPRQSRQRSGAPPGGAPPPTAWSDTWRPLRKEPARRGWKCPLPVAPTDPLSNALHSEEELVITALIIIPQTMCPPGFPLSFPPPLLPPPFCPVFTSCFGGSRVACTCICTGASALVFIQVVTVTTGTVVPSDKVVAELRAASLRVVPTFVIV